MKRFLSTSLLVGLVFLFTCNVLSAQSVKRVLFIGNSYTASNNLPNLIAQMALSTGDSLIYDARTPGGYRFMNHAQDAATMAKISSDQWDFVSLQAQSQEPSWAQGQMQMELFPHAETLVDSIRAHRACTQPIFFTTWGRQNGDAQNCQFVPWVCTYEGMDSALTATYTWMAQQHEAIASPVGPVWRYVREQFPQINLYSGDGSHPSYAGSYAAACTFYAMIFGEDPTAITWNGNLQKDVADSLKVAAKRIAFDEISTWTFGNVGPEAGFVHQFTDSIVTVAYTGAEVDSLHWDFGDGAVSDEASAIHTYTANGTYQVILTTYKCGLSSQDSVSVEVAIPTTSLAQLPFEQFKLFPNPTQGHSLLVLGDHFRQVEWKVLDLAGRSVLNGHDTETSQIALDMTMLPRGVYVLEVKLDGGIRWTGRVSRR
ncbi:DUF4886 domain-containing protein [Pontibacter sp. G13]|uniref:DUF4886 domain-containing protein n=1 Tax=Pontibacter sp. G13 TaxID=3074898 RepID=UPI002889BA9E|nr:DUF4886 domain-containing protein [Pontibacter sp. G13]WNJ18325.1 PKD domain-containing protein [Pontibacter sp. G13]